MEKVIIVISAHPDDETLGLAGTLLRHKKEKDKVYWIIGTEISTDYGYSVEQVEIRHQEINKVASQYGFKGLFNLKHFTTTLTDGDIPILIQKITGIFNKLKPEIVYLPNRSDTHSDHRILFDATFSCTKSFRHKYIKQLLMYECISETEFAPALPEKMFIPNYFIDISDYIEQKIKIMEIYKSELGKHPFPRSIENIKALAHFRGAIAGVAYAEAFQLLKYIR